MPASPQHTPSAPLVLATDAAESEGRYVDARLLGRGGMGAVHEVRDVRIGREVAKKQLGPAHEGDRGARVRFVREACLQGQLEHPAIVPVYDVGIDGQGRPFFTMQRVRGESLAELFRALRARDAAAMARTSRRKLLTAFSQLCGAVHYAHERGIVHRDIKPGNVMLGSYGEVYLIDWGLAKRIDGSGAGEDDPSGSRPRFESLHTVDGAIVGSLGTMSPEQAVGAEAGPASDIYALGAILFEILTLEPLHTRASETEMLAAIVRGVEARIGVRRPDLEVAPELEALVVAATRPHPADRIPSALAMRDEVERYLDGDRDLALRRESARRHAQAAARAADAALAEVGGASVGADLSNGPTAEPEEEAARAVALREVGRALALDPEDPLALATLVRLLTTPPRAVPREVAKESAALDQADLRKGGIAGAWVYGAILLGSPLYVHLGLGDLRGLLVSNVFWLAAFVASLATIRFRGYAGLVVMFAAAVAATVQLSTLLSPLLIVPGVLTAHAAAFATATPRRVRVFVLVMSAASCLFVLAGEACGLLPDTVRFVDGDIVLRTAYRFTEETAVPFLGFVMLASVMIPSLVVGAIARDATRVDQQMRLQAWHLRRLLPAATAS